MITKDRYYTIKERNSWKLDGKKVCLACLHLDGICNCEAPVWCDAMRLHKMGIHDLRKLPEFSGKALPEVPSEIANNK